MISPKVDVESLIREAAISDIARSVARTTLASAPARSASSGPHNVSMRVSDAKTGLSHDLESRSLELGMYLRLKHDPGILTYVTQPQPGVIITDDCQPRHTWPTTPDFFNLRSDSAGYIETRTERRVAELAARHPGLYAPTDRAGEYDCPSAAAYAADRGLTYIVRTERSIGAIETRNLRYLDPFLSRRPPSVESTEHLVSDVGRSPGVTIEALVRGGHAVAVILGAIAAGKVFFNMRRDVLPDHAHAYLYRDATTAAAHEHRDPAATALGHGAPRPVTLSRGAFVRFGDVPFVVEAALAVEVILRDPSTGEIRSWPRHDIERFIRAGSIVADPTNAPVPDSIAQRRAEIYSRASDADLDVATARAVVLGLAPNAATTLTLPSPSGRTKRRWRARQQAEKMLTGDSLAGLIRKPASGGGRRLHPAAFEAMSKALHQHLLCQNPLSIADITRVIGARLKEDGLEALAPCARTVGAHARRISRHAKAEAQLGHRGSHGLAPFRPQDPDAGPPNGDCPWQVVHADSTILDIETVCPFTGTPMGRPTLTALVDGYSGLPMVLLLHYGEPTAATVLRALRRCVERHQRLPELLVLDQAVVHHSTAVQRFATWAKMAIAYRPTAEPRFGSPVERFFLEANRIVARLRGQTRARKHARSLDPTMDPTDYAVWDIASLGAHLDAGVAVLINEPVQATGQSRRERYDRGIELHGVAAVTLFNVSDPAFNAYTLPLVDNGGHRTVDDVKGISVDHLTYWHDAFRSPGANGSKVEVRTDPDDMSHVFALAPEGWVECRARELAHLRVVSAGEWQELSTALAQRHRDTGRARRLTGGAIAALIAAGEGTEQSLLARRKAEAVRATPIQDQAIGSSPGAIAPQPDGPGQVMPTVAPMMAQPLDDLLAEGERDVDLRYFEDEL